MRQTLLFLTLAFAFGASGQVFGIDTVPYVSQEEVLPVELDSFDATID